MIVPAAAAARAIPGSPSAWAMRCRRDGRDENGIHTGLPRTVVAALVALTSTMTRGGDGAGENASTLARSVRSSPAPPAK